MIFPTLTPNIYAVTSFITLTLGSFYISNRIHELWLNKFNLILMDTNAIIKLLIVMLGLAIFPSKSLIDTSITWQLFASIAGIAIGFFYADFERCLLTSWLSQNNLSQFKLNFSESPIKKLTFLKKASPVKFFKANYAVAAIVGACEEILYRGLTVEVCTRFLNPFLSSTTIIVVTLFFALGHLSLGHTHVLSKFILGMICLFAFLITQTIFISIFIHVTFNLIAIHQNQKISHD